MTERTGKICRMIVVNCGRILQGDEKQGLPVFCFVCGAAHRASCVARIQDKESTTIVPLCEPCFASGDRANAVTRKFWNVPDVEIHKGNKVTTEQALALADKQDGTEH